MSYIQKYTNPLFGEIILVIPFYFWNEKMGWRMVWNVYKIVWFYKFRGGINYWDLKILYGDYENWKNGWKK